MFMILFTNEKKQNFRTMKIHISSKHTRKALTVSDGLTQFSMGKKKVARSRQILQSSLDSIEKYVLIIAALNVQKFK